MHGAHVVLAVKHDPECAGREGDVSKGEGTSSFIA